MVTATATQQQRSLNRARAMGGAARVQVVTPNRFQVGGQHDTYSVTISGESWRCSCPAGCDERQCWHLCAVFLWKLAQSARGSVTPPAPVARRWEAWQIEDGACLDCAHVNGHSIYCPAVAVAA